MGNKTYILQKDLLNIKAGSEFVYSPTMKYYYPNANTPTFYLDGSLVENNPDWFKLKEEKEFTQADMVGFATYIKDRVINNREQPFSSVSALLTAWTNNMKQ